MCHFGVQLKGSCRLWKGFDVRCWGVAQREVKWGGGGVMLAGGGEGGDSYLFITERVVQLWHGALVIDFLLYFTRRPVRPPSVETDIWEKVKLYRIQFFASQFLKLPYWGILKLLKDITKFNFKLLLAYFSLSLLLQSFPSTSYLPFDTSTSTYWQPII